MMFTVRTNKTFTVITDVTDKQSLQRTITLLDFEDMFAFLFAFV